MARSRNAMEASRNAMERERNAMEVERNAMVAGAKYDGGMRPWCDASGGGVGEGAG